MLDYNAPVRDMEFVLKELIGYKMIQQLRGCEEVTPDLCSAILEEAGKFAKDRLAPLNKAGDMQGSKLVNSHVQTPDGWKKAYDEFRNSGWCGLSVSEEYGGQGLPKVVASAVNEMWDSANMAFGLCPILTAGAIEAIECHGSDSLRQTYLPKLVSGEWSGTMNLTEPQSGSDLSGVRTKAVPQGDHYLIKGQKIYITYGDHDLTENIIHLVLARLPDAPEGTQGISLFLVPKYKVDEDGNTCGSNEVRCVSLEKKLGIHASPTAVMSFGDQNGSVGYLVGEENKGLMHMFTMMNNARHAVGREGLAISESAYQLALQYAKTRVQGKVIGGDASSIIGHADVKKMLMTMKAMIEAMRGLTYLCAFSFDSAELSADEETRERAIRRGDYLTPVVKGWCTDNAQICASLGVQIHGGMGFVEETGAAQYMRDARILPIYEGTNGIQALDLIGRKTLKDGGLGARELMEDINATIAGLTNPRLENIRNLLSISVEDYRESVDWIIQSGRDPELCNSAASNYLELVGLLCGGWVLATSANIAVKSGSKDDFYVNKIITAEFFAVNMLQNTTALCNRITNGSKFTKELKLAIFN